MTHNVLWLCEVWGKPSQFFDLSIFFQVQNRVSVYHFRPNLAKPLLAVRFYSFANLVSFLYFSKLIKYSYILCLTNL